ncbi:hypothetical protein BJY01DRAFT_242383 [Aspergillus pseudoustus]|uniref:Transcription factor domain-containing protein n=1 Tax=Aspergillus pseudoustus TaxID=1810923 RepID=A0ABR4KYF3_9EURO
MLTGDDWALENFGKLKDCVKPPVDDVASPEDSPDQSDAALAGNQFLFGYLSMVSSLSSYHPSTSHKHILWKSFEENVAPVVMIFHKPSFRKLIYNMRANSRNLGRPSEAVILAVYFAAVTSMSPEQCAGGLRKDRSLSSVFRRFPRLQERYLWLCDTSVPLQWIAAAVIRLARARSWLVAHLFLGPLPIAEQTQMHFTRVRSLRKIQIQAKTSYSQPR